VSCAGHRRHGRVRTNRSRHRHGRPGLLAAACGRVTTWAHHIDHANDNRITPFVYGAHGIVPIGYATFAFASGILIRHLALAVHATTPLDLSRIEDLTSRRSRWRRSAVFTPVDAWVLANTSITSAGHLFTEPASPQYCGENQAPMSA
jgi:hypothetical protein